MPIKEAFEVTGFKELGANLTKFPLNIEKKWVRKALKTAGLIAKEDMAASARRHSPGPSHPDVGHMADNIKITSSLRVKKGAIILVAPSGDHWYSNFQEYGTPHSPADPFIRRALDRNSEAMIATITTILKLGVKIEAAKLRK